jgi:hypothetical protein
MDPRDVDPALQCAYERICSRQQDDIVVFRAWAKLSLHLLAQRDPPLGIPGGYDREEITGMLNAIAGASDTVDEDAAWEAARRGVQDARDGALDARRDMLGVQ